MEKLKNCKLCPRACGIDRNRQKGFCGADSKLKIARASLHMWEEPCISGERGSGTVFFSGCPLRCAYCQNIEISAGCYGKEISVARLAEIFLELQAQGAHNINLVTPTHFACHIVKAIDFACGNGLTLPIVYNSSGYELAEVVEKLLKGYVDIYLTDFKYMNNAYGEKYSGVRDYAEFAKAALEKMVEQVGDCEFDESGILKKGVIVRHLLLPGLLDDSKDVIKYLAETYKNKLYISIMNQYTPMQGNAFPELNRKITKREYESAIDYARQIGVENGFIQEGNTAKESFIPPFDLKGVGL